MDDVARRLLAALMVGAAGPVTGLLVLLLLGPVMMAMALPDRAGSGEGLDGLGPALVAVFVGGLLAGMLAILAGAVASVLALRATHCPHASLAAVACLVLTPLWATAMGRVVGAVTEGALPFPAYVALVGVMPAAVRLACEFVPGRTAPEHSGGGALVP